MSLSSGFERIAGLGANRFTPKELSDPSRRKEGREREGEGGK